MEKKQEAEQYVDRWLMDDFCPKTRQEVTTWWKNGDYEEIIARLSGKRRLTFGTAGLRARMGPGFDRMNWLTVLQTTQGLISYLTTSTTAADRSCPCVVVIGYDGRHNSESFAHITASLFLLKGFEVILLSRPAPTPFIPFLVSRTRGAVCGIQITASHNPKNDNGYKLYWSNGAQIITPIDTYIASSIEANREIWLDVFKIFDPDTGRIRENHPKLRLVFDEVLAEYTQAIVSDLTRNFWNSDTCDVKFAYTAMHGVGT
jgi:phosphoglucomutase